MILEASKRIVNLARLLARERELYFQKAESERQEMCALFMPNQDKKSMPKLEPKK